MMYTKKLNTWHTPATDYPELEVGNFRIHHSHYNRGTYNMNGIDNFIFFEVTKPITITLLQELRGKKWHTWMVDDPPHWRAMEIYAEHSKGRILTTGLGLGLYLQALKGNRNIESVTVVERSNEVVQLVEPYLPILPGLVIVLEDFYEFIGRDNTSWDTILIDLWVAHGAKEKIDILYHNVLPLAAELWMRHPKASLTFHGFYSVSDIPFTSQGMVDKIVKMRGED